jgi:PPOX class probable F420-dependent enzyme
MNEFIEATYVSVRTFRPNGDPVATPVWCAVLDGKLYFGTPAHTHKVKRIANNRSVEVAACDSQGNTNGEWRTGSARRLSRQEFKTAKGVIERRRPLKSLLMNVNQRLRRWDYVGYEIEPTVDTKDEPR